MMLNKTPIVNAGIATMVMITIALSGVGDALAIDWGREALEEDRATCEAVGASYGSNFTGCMLEQQRRRDEALANAPYQQMINAAVAAQNLETVRRMRCEREAQQQIDRGETPQWCG